MMSPPPQQEESASRWHWDDELVSGRLRNFARVFLWPHGGPERAATSRRDVSPSTPSPGPRFVCRGLFFGRFRGIRLIAGMCEQTKVP